MTSVSCDQTKPIHDESFYFMKPSYELMLACLDFHSLALFLLNWSRPVHASLLKVSHDGMSFKITKLMLIPVNNLCYLIKFLSLFPAGVIYSPFIALSIFVVLSNFCRIIKILPSWGIELFFLGINISLVTSQDIPSCETFSRAAP